MKKLLLLVLILLSIFLGYSLALPKFLEKGQEVLEVNYQKTPILRVALVADSHNENDLLAKALEQAKGQGINFVIGLGDYTNLGTEQELKTAKAVFEKSGLEYYTIPGDRDGWDSRNKGDVNYFVDVFGPATQTFDRNSIHFVLLDNSDLYKGISPTDWQMLEKVTKVTKESKESNVLKTSDSSDSSVTFEKPSLVFVFVHKTPFHPESSHVMGEDSPVVAEQANRLIKLVEDNGVDGLFSGDLHFFAQFKSSQQSVRITTVGAVARERNFQGPRFAILTVFGDYTWEVEDIEIR